MKKLVQVVMLPTKNAENAILKHSNGMIRHYSGLLTQSYLQEINEQSFHLYLISPDREELEEGDLIHTTNVPIERIKGIDKEYSTQPGYEWLITVEGNGNQYKPCELHGKIIASTDPFLPVGKLSEDFLDAYVAKQGQIVEVMVEYGLIGTDKVYSPSLLGELTEYAGGYKYTPKQRKDGTVIVSPAKVYPEKTVKKALKDGIDFGLSKMGVLTGNKENEFIQKWLEQNG